MRRIPSLHVTPAWHRALLGGGIGLVVGVVLLWARDLPLLQNLEGRLTDVRTEAFPLNRPPDPRIVVAEITDEDVTAVQESSLGYRWPWGLDFTAYAFRLMYDAGARAVLVDVFQLDQGAGPEDVRDPPKDEKSPRYRELEDQGQKAAEFGDALAAGNTALAFELATTGEYEMPARVEAAEARLGGDRVAGGPDGIVRPHARLPVVGAARGAKLLGFANVHAESDGIVRRAFLVGRWGSRRALSLPLAGALLLLGGDARFDGEGGLRLGPAAAPVMPDGSFLVSFHDAPPGRAYPRVAPWQILQWAMEQAEKGEVPAAAREALEGKIVVWGVQIAGLKDIVTTPVSGVSHGPEFQATVLDDLLHGDGRIFASRITNALLLLVVVVVLGLLAGGLRSRWALHAVPLAVVLAGLAFALWQFRRGVSFDVATPFLGVVFTWGGTTTLHMLTAGRRNRWLEGTFGRYLAPSIIEALKRDPGLIDLGGRRREITILFSDVAGFTKISEKLQPEQTVSLLNHYLTMHAAAVMAAGGVVDKFEGDAVMAFFGDPVEATDHAGQACRAALDVAEQLPSLRPVWEGFGLDHFAIRIGLNTGSAVVGNMGSAQRFDYTCMGDNVNLASRLEGANKVFGSVILIGSATYEAVKEEVVARPLASIVVVGRSKPEPVYDLLALRASAPPDLLAHVDAFVRAGERMRRGDLDGAGEALDRARALRDDGPVRWLGALLDRLRAGTEPSPWSGILVLESK